MFSLVLSICAAFGPSIADEAPRTWMKLYKAAQSAVAPQEIDWVAYYKGHSYTVNSGRIQYVPVFPPSTMQWAVPLNMGGLPPYGLPDRYSPYGGYETPVTNPPATPKK
ncbi:MAG: hypothetical protein EXS16_18265 [Gemmataceae bacterium]|nr:hypothetical protein [Gemmataceae bacterium]